MRSYSLITALKLREKSGMGGKGTSVWAISVKVARRGNTDRWKVEGCG
jgi:hypothetical protein